MTRRQLKPEQATAAHTLDRHVSVTAGPGSGKTTVLVERYLHILRENNNLNIDQIVAITFTHRAANEMRERLRNDLDRILADCSPKERSRWLRYKRTLDGAIISTIHGFCARLLREFPVEARIDPQFLSLDSHDANILLEASVEETLTELISKGREVISQLAVGFGRGKLAEALTQLYTEIRGQGLDLDTLVDRTIASHATTESYQQALAELDQTIAELLGSAHLSPSAFAKQIQAREAWPALQKLIRQERPALGEYCNAIENFRGTRININFSPGKVTEKLDELLWAEKGAQGRIPRICFDHFAKEYALELIFVLGEIEHRYQEKKNNLAALDFEDLQLRALDLLGLPAVVARTTQRYRFLLVDEFQDTNSVQRELMHRLALQNTTTKANLFIVGDRKQSIYGFRGADVDVFQQTTQTLMLAGGIEQPLHLNFRSQPPLIKFFNQLFARLFEREVALNEQDRGELGLVDFEPSTEERAQEHQSPLVELLIDTKQDGDDSPKAQSNNAERDAWQVAQRIISLTATAESTEQDQAPLFAFRDIALLFRARTDVPTYETILRRANIPYQTVQGKGFYERQEISDLIQLLRFLDNNTDELALTAVLRSPLGGISDNALLALRCAPRLGEEETDQAMRHFNHPRRLFYALCHYREIAFLDTRDQAQLDRVGELLRSLVERRNHYPLADLLRYAVDQSEYRTVIAANFDGAQRLANVQKLFTLAERFARAGAHLVRDFVHYVEDFEDIGSREGEGQIDESANAVRLLTIHQAKGLEFPVVIIPNLHHRSMRALEHWYALDRHQGITVRVPDGRGNRVTGLTFERFRERANLRAHAESIRLLYVAATRAEDRLIFSGVTDELEKLNGSADNWLKLIWQKLDLQVSASGVFDIGGDAQLAVTLNLADALHITNADETVDSDRSEVPPSLVEAFPLLCPLTELPGATQQTQRARFSVTQLINYRRCPRQYYFERVLHVPSADALAVWNDAEAPEPPANLNATMKGAVIHRFCETYTAGDDLEARLRESFAEVISTRQAQLADRLFEIDRDEAIRELLPLARNYLGSDVFRRVQYAQSLSRAGNVRPTAKAGIWSELSFRLLRPGGVITGTIDKLLVTPSASGDGFDIEIIDFKTNRIRDIKTPSPVSMVEDQIQKLEVATKNVITSGRRRKSPASAQYEFDFSLTQPHLEAGDETSLSEKVRVVALDYELQMQAYVLAIRQLLPELTATARIKSTLHFLEPDVEYSLTDESTRPEVCAEEIDHALAQLLRAAEPDDFLTSPAAHCRICSYLPACSAGRDWLKRRRDRRSVAHDLS